MTAEEWPRVKALFHAALDRPVESRGAFLAEACGEWSEGRVEVERLLAAHAGAGPFIESSPVSGLLSDAASAMPSLIGLVLGHYEVRHLIGRGGMGDVYAAHDTELQRTVALKIVSSPSGEAHLGLRREAQHASKLNHPNICTIHEVGAWNGRPYIVMEYVEGRGLLEEVAAHDLSAETVLRYGGQIAGALAHAHSHGVIHRDLKTANVVVTSDGRAKILDFGLARTRRPDPQPAPSAEPSRADDRLAGTLGSMAPELLRGSTADERSDIWSLGVLLYEMAAGRGPFDRGTAFERSADILGAAPPPLPPEVPAALDEVIRRCLAKAPADRYANAGEVCEALDAAAAGVASHGERSRGSRVKAFVGRRFLPVSLSAVAIVAASAWFLSSWTTRVGPSPSDPRTIAVMYFQSIQGGDTAWLAKGIPSMLLTTLAQTRGLHLISTQRLHEAVRQGGGASLDTLAEDHVSEVARRAGASAVVVGTIFKSGTELRIDARLEDLADGKVLLAETVRGTEVFPLVDELATRIRSRLGFDFGGTGEAPRGVAEVSSSSLEAYRLYSEGEQAALNFRLDDAAQSLERAVAIDPGFARAFIQLASVSEFQNRPAARAGFLRSAADHADRLSERERLLVEVEWARERGDLSKAAELLDLLIGRFPDFENAYSSALLYEPFRGALYDPPKQVALLATGVKTLPTSGGVRNFYGYALMADGKMTEALHEFETYVRLAVREPNAYDSLAEWQLMMARPEKALGYYAQALTIDPRFGSRSGRAWAWSMMGRYDEAIAEQTSMFGLRAFILSRAGRYHEADEALRAGLEAADAGRNPIQAGEMRVMSSMLALERQQYDRARADAADAARLFGQGSDERTRVNLVLVDVLRVMTDIRAGRPGPAHANLAALGRRYRPAVPVETWWYRTLEGNLAIAEHRWREADAAFAAGEPAHRVYANFSRTPAAFVLAHNFPGRDGRARALEGRGDLGGALKEYQRLEATGEAQKWLPAVEPRLTLLRASLLERLGDAKTARIEYLHFIDFWQHADPDRPELAAARQGADRTAPR